MFDLDLGYQLVNQYFHLLIQMSSMATSTATKNTDMTITTNREELLIIIGH